MGDSLSSESSSEWDRVCLIFLGILLFVLVVMVLEVVCVCVVAKMDFERGLHCGGLMGKMRRFLDVRKVRKCAILKILN